MSAPPAPDLARLLVRWLLPRSGERLFLAALVFWNPLLAAAITFVLSGRRDFVRSWLVSLTVSHVVAISCFTGVKAMRVVESAVYRWSMRTAPSHGTAFYLLVAGALMPLALPLGFRASGLTAAWLGSPRSGPPNMASYRIAAGFGLTMLALYFFMHSRGEAREAARKAEARIQELETARLRAQLSALTSEMNPHLLFNALNTVASLVHQDPDQAEEVVLQLSDLYRGVLRSAGAASHSLGEEIDLCEAYLRIEHARFGDRLTIDVDVDADVDRRGWRIPVLLVQPLVENAIKHGIAPLGRGGRVSLRVRPEGRGFVVIVEDDGVGIGSSPIRGAGKAVANVRDRLKLTYGEEARLELAARPGGGTRAVVSIPSTALDEGST